MGKTHRVCQDYALSMSNPDRCIGVVSDGCSVVKDPTGTEIEAHTDVGSRLLAWAAYRVLKDRKLLSRGVSIEVVAPWLILDKAICQARAMGLPSGCLSATLLAAYADSDTMMMNTTLSGDGVIAARRRGSRIWEVMEFHFPGPPYYLRYELDGSMKQKYVDMCGTAYKATHYTIKPDGSSSNFFDTSLCFSDHPKAGPQFVRYGYPRTGSDAVVIATDGIFAFRKRTSSGLFESIPSPMILAKFLQFSRKGSFMVRACNKAMRAFAKEGIEPADDVSMAVIEDVA